MKIRMTIMMLEQHEEILFFKILQIAYRFQSKLACNCSSSLGCSAIIFHRCRAAIPTGQYWTINECSSGQVMSISSFKVGYTKVKLCTTYLLLLKLFNIYFRVPDSTTSSRAFL